MSNLFSHYSEHFQPYDVPADAENDIFKLELPFSADWDSSPNKMLIIVGHVDRQDLRDRRLFPKNGVSTQVLENTLTYARRAAKQLDKNFNRSEFAYAAINFNHYRTYGKSSDYQTTANQMFSKRVMKYIHIHKPTHILILSDQAARLLIGEQITAIQQRAYNVFDLKLAGIQCKVTTSIDFCRTFDSNVQKDDGENDGESSVGMACLLGFVSRCMTALYLGENPYNFALKDFKANPVLIDSIPKFKTFYKELLEQKIVGFDSEWTYGDDVGVGGARFLTVQFAWTVETGYVIPLYHRESPFNAEELAYIEKKLRSYFMRKVSDEYELIMQNAQGDLTMIRALLGVPFMYYHIWDTIMGEVGLDENAKFLTLLRKDKINSLDTLTAQYGSSFYLDGTTFSKEHRGGLKDTSLSGDALNYCSADAQVIVGIRRTQLFRAKHTNFGKDGTESYLPAYKRFVRNQLSNNMYAVSHMEHRGIWVDIELMQATMLEGSDFRNELKRLTDMFYGFPSVKKANKVLLRESNSAATSMFGSDPVAFKMTSQDHMKLLFFGVLNLEPVSFTDSGSPSTDDVFQEAYRETIPEVETFSEVNKLLKIQSTYLKGWYKRIMSNADSRKDWRIRPKYGFFEVVTGRSNSSKPSLQNVPARHKTAKYIKRLFAARSGHLIIKMDFSAHEVRQAAIVAGDSKLAEAFHIGRNLRKEYIQEPTDELGARIDLEGDVHKLNYNFIFKIELLKITKSMRDSVKAVVFGLLYGKSVKTLSVDISKGTIGASTKDFKKSREEYFTQKEKDPDQTILGKLRLKVKSLKDKLDELLEKSRDTWVAETQVVYDAFLNRNPRTKRWLEWAVEMGRKHFYVYSPFGRKRNLYAHLTGIDNLCAAMDRRAMNSPIQGMGADIGHTTNYMFHKEFYETLLKFGLIDEDCRELPAGIETMVHDSIRLESEYRLVLIAAYILQWCATVGTAKYYTEVFDVDIIICNEIDLEFGSSDVTIRKWDWSKTGKNGLENVIRGALEDQHKEGKCPDVDAAYAQIMDIPDRELRYLEKHYPVVGDFPIPTKVTPYINRENFMKNERKSK